MKLVCDTDALIKLNKAGLLRLLVQRTEILVGHEVWHEAVDAGKAHGYPDAFEIERLVSPLKRKRLHVPAQARALLQSRQLGAGEQEALKLYFSEGAEAIVSDDRGFLHLLEAHGLPYLTPTAILVWLAEHRVLRPLSRGYQALEKLKPYIRPGHYEETLKDLQKLERSKP